MQGFFSSPRYGNRAREIAGGLLVNVANVSSFDAILKEMQEETDRSNFVHLTSVAQMLGFAQRAKHHIKGAASDINTPFLIQDVDEIDPNPQDFERNQDQQLKVAAWKIDTASAFLLELWRAPDKQFTPSGEVLRGAVLENGDFDNLDFSRTHLDFGILYNATFRNVRFNQATLKDVFVRHVNLQGADFGGIATFSGSRWEDTNWWQSKCVPKELLDYLVRETKHTVSQEERTSLIENCK